jgi:hypothetical protein
VATAYAVAGDVDPRVGEHLLDVLAVRGIAAYLQPAADLHPVTRTTTLPSRPTDRLYVDRDHLQTARAFLTELADEAPAEAADTEVDDAFNTIVAGFHTEVTTITWPAAEDVPDPPEPQPDKAALPRWSASTIEPTPDPPSLSLIDGLDMLGAGLPDEDEEGYTPPPPPPVPRPSAATVVAVLGIISGFIVFLNPQVLPVSDTINMMIGFAAILGGVITLIWRLRSGDEDDDHWDPDDGAVV